MIVWISYVTSVLSAGERVIGRDDVTGQMTVQLAFIVPSKLSYPFSRARIEPAVALTLEKVEEMQLLPNSSLFATYQDSHCNSIQAPLAAFQTSTAPRPLVFMGPVCDYSLAPVARYAKFWGIPVVTPGAFAHDFAEKTSEYPLLTRLGSTFNTLSRFVETTVLELGFKRMKLVYNSTGHSDVSGSFCFLQMAGLIDRLKKTQSLDFSATWFLLNDKPDDEIKKILKEDIGTSYSGDLQKP